MRKIVIHLTEDQHARLRHLAHRDRRTADAEARVLVERILDLAERGSSVTGSLLAVR